MADEKHASGLQRQMTFKQYKKEKIRMLKSDFCLPMTQEELAYMHNLTTETEIDQFYVTMLNKYWR